MVSLVQSAVTVTFTVVPATEPPMDAEASDEVSVALPSLSSAW